MIIFFHEPQLSEFVYIIICIIPCLPLFKVDVKQLHYLWIFSFKKYPAAIKIKFMASADAFRCHVTYFIQSPNSINDKKVTLEQCRCTLLYRTHDTPVDYMYERHRKSL